MRWDELFADLEGQLEAGLTAEERDLEAEEERLRLGRLSLRDRIAGIAAGNPDDSGARIQLVDGRVITLRPRTLGRDWIAGDLQGGGDAQAILPLAGVASVLPTSAQLGASLRQSPEANTALTDRLGLPFVLRDLARRRRAVELVTMSGTLTGTLDRVGRDHADLADHPTDLARRRDAVRQIRIVPLVQLVLVVVP